MSDFGPKYPNKIYLIICSFNFAISKTLENLECKKNGDNCDYVLICT